MSQAKVDQYKKEKATRKKTLAKQKVARRIGKIATLVVVLAAVGFGVYKGIDNYYDNLPANTYYVDLTAIQDYTSALDEE
ncbi:MAG: hypothetical protein E7282_01625 [Lachnospiraceae bacterium]|nr:hypothetical protein [Lachnospiraceae bacterium]